MPRKTIILPDKLFHKLWDEAANRTEEEYKKLFLSKSSDEYIDFERKYEIEPFIASKMLKKIYQMVNESFSDLLKRTNLKNSQIADRYCIGIRNVQQWANGKAKCPSYVKLMILRDEHMMDFDGFIMTQWEKEFREKYPKIYTKTIKSNDSNNIYNNERTHLDEYLNRINEKNIDNLKERTDYLDEIIKKVNK